MKLGLLLSAASLPLVFAVAAQAADARAADVAVDAAPAGDGLIGRVVNADGSPLPGAEIIDRASGRRADEEDSRFGGSLASAPPVPTTAIFSRTDGVCAWQGCREQNSSMTDSIEVESSHCGMGHHPAVVYAVADRLAQKDGEWAPFDRSGWRSLVYPDPNR